MKRIIKNLLTRINCIIFKIPYKSELYIGYGTKIVGRDIIIGERVEIMAFLNDCFFRRGKYKKVQEVQFQCFQE